MITSRIFDSIWMVAAWPELCATFLFAGRPTSGMAMFSQGLGIDFSDGSQGMPLTKKPKATQGGEPRPWLRVFETCPAQLLNAYGMSKIATMPDDKVWDALSQPLATGAMYGTELASKVHHHHHHHLHHHHHHHHLLLILSHLILSYLIVVSQVVERRGVGLNRAIHALLQYCQLQQSEDVKKRSQYCLKESEWYHWYRVGEVVDQQGG